MKGKRTPPKPRSGAGFAVNQAKEASPRPRSSAGEGGRTWLQEAFSERFRLDSLRRSLEEERKILSAHKEAVAKQPQQRRRDPEVWERLMLEFESTYGWQPGFLKKLVHFLDKKKAPLPRGWPLPDRPLNQWNKVWTDNHYRQLFHSRVSRLKKQLKLSGLLWTFHL